MFDEFIDFAKRCFRKAELPKWWGKVVNLVTLILGWLLVWLVYKQPELTSSSQARISLLCVVIIPVATATLAVLGRLLISPFLVNRETEKNLGDARNKIAELEERLKSKLTVEYKEDGQCNLAASSGHNIRFPGNPPVTPNAPHFRVRLHLGGIEKITNVIATVQAIKKNGFNLPLSECIRLRFHNAGNGADSLGEMNPGDKELLDVFKEDHGKFSLAIARWYNSFNFYLCDEPGTYEIKIRVTSSGPEKEFVFLCPWTGDFTTTHCDVLQ